MTIKQWLDKATRSLTASGIASARLDAELLLAHTLNVERTWLLAHHEARLQGDSLQTVDGLLKRRSAHEPMAYIRGYSEFYGRQFLLGPHTLEPRPESETMITLLKYLPPSDPSIAKNDTWQIVDVGTGSGALAVTTKLELPETEAVATDIDPKCVKVAQQNATRYQVDVEFRQGDLLRPLDELSSNQLALLCNLPYVPNNFQINLAATHEPRHAIYGGADGLDLYRRLFEQIKTSKNQPHYVLTEAMPPQHDELARIAADSGYRLTQTNDFVQLFTPNYTA